ncbi:lipopolysaccharide biosynthesis protein [Rhodococcoides fascians A25f]|uniref:lipopolysaccharide biosynthesis protein n=1 Tax=Rhodococcoides fascians TaxID=1828 RepID=UPI00068F940E|nr:lipopolysaccharide biosynthesis protein [Rhodococcus fascians]QII08113.1 lipopolysaccharide biosynthesis protein [Rhodococcus fascians A25f]
MTASRDDDSIVAGSGNRDLKAGYGGVAARGASATLAGQAIKFLVQFGSIPILARLLEPDAFGLVAMVTAVIGIAEILRDFGLSTAAVQARSLTDRERTNLFWANSSIGICCAGLVMLLSWPIAAIYGDGRLGPICLALSVIFFLNGMAAQFIAEVNRSMKFVRLAIIDLLPQIVGLAVAVVAAFSGASYWSLVIQQIVASAFSLLIAVLLCRWRPGLPCREVSIVGFVRFGGGLVGTRVMSYFAQNADNVAIGITAGSAQLGLYSRAYQLLLLPLQQINVPVSRVAVPILSRIQDDRQRYDSVIRRAQLLACYFTATVFAFVAGVAEPVVRIVFGSQWTEVTPVLAVLAIGGAFRSVSQVGYWMFVSKGKTGSQFRLYLWTQPLIVVALIAGTAWGIMGVAVAHSIAYFVFWILLLFFAGRMTNTSVKPLFLDACRSLLLVAMPIGLLSLLVVSALSFGDFLEIIIAFGAGCSYVGLLALLVVSVRRDLWLLLTFVKKSMGK